MLCGLRPWPLVSLRTLQSRGVSVRKQIETLLKTRKPINIDSKDIRETTALGDGPGGQAVSKTLNAVRLLHVPTGAAVRSHKTRSLELNRRDALVRLRAHIDDITNGEASLSAIERLREKARKHSALRKSKAKHFSQEI